MALSEASKEAVHLTTLSEELGIYSCEADGPVDVSCDNTGARNLAYNPDHHSRVKHIERRHFFVREMVENLSIRVPFVSTCDNLADFFTKPLPARSFYQMRDVIMNVPPHERDYTSHLPAADPFCMPRPHNGEVNAPVRCTGGGLISLAPPCLMCPAWMPVGCR